AIIAADVFEQVQRLLIRPKAKPPAANHRAPKSPLAGKLFDETGTTLTPSHTKSKGRPLRYYISRRLIKERRSTHPTAWRLPAVELERYLATRVQELLQRPAWLNQMLPAARAAQLIEAQKKLQSKVDHTAWLLLIDRVDIKAGEADLRLCATAVAELLNTEPGAINQNHLTTTIPFTLRRRGVELKFVQTNGTAHSQQQVDTTLLNNLALAHTCLDAILSGQSFTEVAEQTGISKRRIQSLITLAMLAPDLQEAVLNGQQPTSMTSDRLLKKGVPLLWEDQRAAFA
ncbi:recombinase family protein, partial [Nereida sp. MMG024]|nr:recombinase family protein [Nereida sp. MMG025]